MAHVTGDRRARGNGVAAEGPVGLGLGEGRPQAIGAVTGLAVGAVGAEEAAMPAVPEAGVIDVVHAVRAVHATGQSSAVAGGAFSNDPAVPLDLGRGNIVIG